MRWYFAIDQAGAGGSIGEHAKLAVLSAAAIGGLEPVLLYYGKRTDFTAWMTAHGVEVIDTAPDFLPTIRAAEAAGTYRPFSIGHWLRIGIPRIEQGREFVLYTDCDVVFLRPVAWHLIRPDWLAAGPEFSPAGWGYFNAGVMVLNVPALRASYDAFEAHIRAAITNSGAITYDDQTALNDFYRDRWERLDPSCNWKPYWGYDRRAAILHFHGPKLNGLEAIAAGRWPRDTADNAFIANMLDACVDGYIAWCNVLGDALQTADLSTALRCHRLASSLVRYRPSIQGADRSFLGR